MERFPKWNIKFKKKKKLQINMYITVSMKNREL